VPHVLATYLAISAPQSSPSWSSAEPPKQQGSLASRIGEPTISGAGTHRLALGVLSSLTPLECHDFPEEVKQRMRQVLEGLLGSRKEVDNE
jgi:hypothetical protein